MTKSTQTIEQAAEAIEAAGHKRYDDHEGDVRFYDPKKSGKYVTLEGGYFNDSFADFVKIGKDNGVSGAFARDIRAILEANQSEIAA